MPVTPESLRAAILRSVGSNAYHAMLVSNIDHYDIANLLNKEFAVTYVCEGQHVPPLFEMCPDCEPYIETTCGHYKPYCLVFHASAEMDTHVNMTKAQLEGVKRSIERLLADRVYPCRQKGKI